MSKISTVLTELMCPHCGNVVPIQRKTGKTKKIYHLKNMYCYVCDKETNHIELGNKDILVARLKFKEDLTEEERIILALLDTNKAKVKKLQ